VRDAGVLWIDAEGQEGQILSGAGELTEAGVPVVLEFNPASLDEHGDRGAIHEVAERSYTHFVDVRRRKRFGLREVAELQDYARELANRSAFTDVLLLRLEGAQANIELPKKPR
jgi:hypothetical protein